MPLWSYLCEDGVGATTSQTNPWWLNLLFAFARDSEFLSGFIMAHNMLLEVAAEALREVRLSNEKKKKEKVNKCALRRPAILAILTSPPSPRAAVIPGY